MLSATPSELSCLDALSYDVCTNDASFVCSARFFLDVSPSYRQQQFTYLINQFILERNVSVQWLLSQLLVPGATYPFSVYLDGTYGVSCSSDTTVQSDLSPSVTDTQAADGRLWWLLLMRGAEFCPDNQIFVQNMGCVCKEDKTCDETKTSQFTSVMTTMIFVVITVLIITLVSVYVFTRQAQGLSREFRALVKTNDRTMGLLQTATNDSRRSMPTAATFSPAPAPTSTPTPQPQPTPVRRAAPSDQTERNTMQDAAALVATRMLVSTPIGEPAARAAANRRRASGQGVYNAAVASKNTSSSASVPPPPPPPPPHASSDTLDYK